MSATSSQPAQVISTADSIKIRPQAIRSFVFHHGGTEREAEIQIRCMLADFLELSGRTVTTANYLALSRDGYRLDIGPSRNVITGYRSAHRERTWEQVKRGIPSRMNTRPADPMPLLASLASDPSGSAPLKRPTPLTAAKIRLSTGRVPSAPAEHRQRLEADLVAHTAATESTASPFVEPAAHQVASVEGERQTPTTDDTAIATEPTPVGQPSTAHQSTRRQVSLTTAAAIALCAFLIGRRSSRRR